MAVGLYSGVSDLALGTGLYKNTSGLWSGASGLTTGFGGGGLALSLNFLSGTLDRRITFSRGSQGTIVDSTGRVTYAPNNLLLQSGFAGAVSGTPGTPPTSWTNFSSGGTLDVTSSTFFSGGNLLTFSVTSARHFISQSYTVAANTNYIFSFYVRANSGAPLDTIYGSGTQPTGTTITFTVNGVATTSAYVPVANDRIGVNIAVAATAGTYSPRLGLGVSVNATGSVSLEAPQLEAVTYQTTPGTYNATTTAAYYGPRFDYDPVTLAAKGLLIEEQRANLLTYSEDLSNAAWTKAGATVATNPTTAPDGTSSADTLTEAATLVAHLVSQTYAGYTLGSTYTFSMFVKKGNGSTAPSIVQLTFPTAAFGTGQYANFNISTGAVLTNTGGTATITNFGNGWYRITWTATATATASGAAGLVFTNNNDTLGRTPVYTGATTSDVYIWGAQLEAGSFATSYIPTVASTATRSADVATMTGTNFSQWYNQSEGTFVSEFSSISPSANQSAWGISDGTNSNRWFTYISSSFIRHVMITAGVNQADIIRGAYTQGVIYKSAFAVASNSVQAAVNGVLGTEDTSATLPTVDRLRLGTSPTASTGFLNGHIRSIAYYNTRLPNATLQALTA